MSEKPETSTSLMPSSDGGEQLSANESARGAAPSAAAPWASFLDHFTEIGSRLSRLESLLTGRSSDNSEGNAVLRELHAQLQEARTDLHWKILRPVLLDVVKLHDEMAAAAKSLGSPDQAVTRTTELLTGFLQDIQDILSRQGFSVYAVEGDRFDARRQQPVNTLPAPSPDHVGTIVTRVASGFASDQRVLRPEKVIVYGPSRSPAAS